MSGRDWATYLITVNIFKTNNDVLVSGVTTNNLPQLGTMIIE